MYFVVNLFYLIFKTKNSDPDLENLLQNRVQPKSIGKSHVYDSGISNDI